MALIVLEEVDRFLARRDHLPFEAAVRQGLFDQFPDEVVVLMTKTNNNGFCKSVSPAAGCSRYLSYKVHTRSR